MATNERRVNIYVSGYFLGEGRYSLHAGILTVDTIEDPRIEVLARKREYKTTLYNPANYADVIAIGYWKIVEEETASGNFSILEPYERPHSFLNT